MTDDLEDLKRRLVVGHKSDGRSVYDEAAKSDLVALCRQPGASVSRLARECGVNANQVGCWLREHGQGRVRKAGGANASANLYSFIETAKANNIEPYRYLAALFKRLPLAQTVDDYEARLPWSIELGSL